MITEVKRLQASPMTFEDQMIFASVSRRLARMTGADLSMQLYCRFRDDYDAVLMFTLTDARSTLHTP